MRRCPDARGGMRFYASRLNYWRGKMGAPVVRGPHPRRGCPLYLAHVLQRKSFAARRVFERWWKERDQIIRRLDRGVAGTAMAGTGAALERWGRRYGVSPYFMVAAAATESSRGDAACDTYNAWGLGNCGSAWSVPSFSSWGEAIAYYARFIARGWPGHSTPYSFSGYAKCDSCWGNTVSRWMRSLFGVPAVTRYP